MRELPRSFLDSLKLHPPPVPIDLQKAYEQHAAYTKLIQQLVGAVVLVPADENCPDCVFIEDTLLSLGSHFIITRPGAPERSPEVQPVKLTVEHFFKDRPTLQASMHEIQAPATLDGGDVMFDGACLWVGLTDRTNEGGVQQLKAILEPCGIPVVGIKVLDPDGLTLHLKSLVSAIGDRHVLVADNVAGHTLIEAATSKLKIKTGVSTDADAPEPEMSDLTPKARSQGGQTCSMTVESTLRITLIPDQLCANVLRIGNNVVMQAGFPASEVIIRGICHEQGLALHTLDMSELAKADGALTCCSVLARILV
ncbi:hypothetical protein CEUSTIGMA_g2048.t1 [Chlamydomonas eustigma]|uniref:Uncharacterized protein n=1 Tax=Chlamydomonas eustigma TaxID=1157962 RepID=A0A250WVP2_9CHLO|nr:hypothetical protein CEUSTIGMA_g2048.t1 [Chlamydomonas eustigma]|eukprot:GAX74600.1 hypothetical protein CEUSTIGMA_g2048.t1 [Chlamydomonas eustigma]